ncbi:MAG TPA: TIGR00269 family protein [Candidatus Nanoarchaeia archaeon]|nr:TIGR00269 family protein [Candidatus Nanoarchaeia archaeon]
MQININNKNCCSEKPVIQLTAGEKLCKNHFNEYFENKVFKTIRQFDLLGKEENLGVAISGGKDSLTVLRLLNKLSKQNPKIKITAIAIDEGIAGYRDKTLATAQKFCDENNIKLNIFSYKDEFGLTLDEMLKILDVKPCSICGVFRRYLLNKKSIELKLTKLATGHNLDDECQSIMMNQMKNNIGASARLGPKVGVSDDGKFSQRIKPLYLCMEKEVTTYAFINGLLDNFNECPNVAHSFRAQVRDMLNGMEQKFAGTKYSIVNSFLETLPILKEKFKGEMAQACSKCGEPSANETCSACNYLERLKKSVMHQN